MKRRTVLRGLLAAFTGTSVLRLQLANAAGYFGKFLVVVQAEGGWDPTSFCDPKVNQKGEAPINHWADSDEPGQAGNITYAPFANNKPFFDDHHDKMLVINGVDAQTNSHTTGVIHNWSGRISEGYPTMSALLAGHYGADLTVPYLNFGGFSATSGIARFTRLDNAEALRVIVHSGDIYLRESDWADLVKYRGETIARLTATPNLLPTDERNRSHYLSALESEQLKEFVSVIPPEDELEKSERVLVEETGHAYHSDLRRQVQLTVLAFKTGAAVSADLRLGGFDTHTAHDGDHGWLLGNLTDGVNYLWEYAEEHGVADRMVVVMGSDFARTNHYNSDNGKDHWPFGSFIVMEKNQPWTNRVVGETDERHFAYNIDPATLERVDDSDPKGTHIYPKHMHKALRRYLGVENFAARKGFPFNNTEDFAFFR